MQATDTMISDKEALKKEIRSKRALREIADLDYRRSVKKAYDSGILTQQELAASLGIKQPSVSYTVKKAKDAADPREGFSGATPYEICQRYNIGVLSKKQLINELSRWDYVESSVNDGYDSLVVDLPGTFHEVERAVIAGLIDSEIYSAVLERLFGYKRG